MTRNIKVWSFAFMVIDSVLFVSKAQGFFPNATSLRFFNYTAGFGRPHRHVASSAERGVLIEGKADIDVQQYDQFFRPERREPRFISFETRNDEIDIEVDFRVPFVTVPVTPTMSGAMSYAQNVLRGQTPLANINVAALMLGAIVTLVSALIGFLIRLGMKQWSDLPAQYYQYRDESEKSGGYRFNQVNEIFERVEKSLLRYDIDLTACTSRVVCWHVKNAVQNVRESNHPSRLDEIVDGVTSANWAMKMVSGTNIYDAIQHGRKGKNCEFVYPHCKLDSKHMADITRKIFSQQQSENEI